MRSVTIREVGPRDGLQNEPERVCTDDKVRMVEALARTGVPRIEITSFVREDVVPQLADGGEVLARADVPKDVSVSVLIPNGQGLARALEQRERFDTVTVFLSASESHNQRNVGRSVASSLEGVGRVLQAARDEDLRCTAVIATAFGCPYEGRVAPDRVLGLARSLAGAGAQEISLGDTTGMANPIAVRALFEAAADAVDVELTAHFHNTRGQALANVLGALQAGCASFESSVGELGGCPVPAGATGNVATEDLVCLLHEMGIDTGIDLPALLAVARDVQRMLGRPLGSHTLIAGPVDWR
jgi:hydroxymethylglutaryl-CoA lyase